MDDLNKSKEFFGRFGISYKDGDIVYGYDEITHGLYQFSLASKEVALVLSPADIHCYSEDRMMGISKSGNEIILVPLFLDAKWIFFDVETQKVRYDSPVKSRIRISAAITIDKNLYLIPSDVCGSIVILSLDGMREIKIYEKWYPENENTGSAKYIWGASSYGERIVFPVIHSGNIILLDAVELKIIRPEISCRIASVSVWKNRIWILPASGGVIYAVDCKGNVAEVINLFAAEVSADKFSRIIATEDNVFLLPMSGEDTICVYRQKKGQFVQIEKGRSLLKGKTFAQSSLPYWDFLIEDKVLHLLPCNYGYRTIDLSSLESNEGYLCYGKNIDDGRYWRITADLHKSCVVNEKNGSLEDFIQAVLWSPGMQTIKEQMGAGKQIWEKIQ